MLTLPVTGFNCVAYEVVVAVEVQIIRQVFGRVAVTINRIQTKAGGRPRQVVIVRIVETIAIGIGFIDSRRHEAVSNRSFVASGRLSFHVIRDAIVVAVDVQIIRDAIAV